MKVVNVRPSPNEEARLLKEERDRRRKLRIKQVFELLTNSYKVLKSNFVLLL